MTEIKIVSFDPLTITWPIPDDEGMLYGDVRIALPNLHIQVYDLSMDGLIPGNPHMGADTDLLGWKLETGDKGIKLSLIHEFIMSSLPLLREAHEKTQAYLDQRGALL